MASMMAPCGFFSVSSYVYDHAARDLARRLTHSHHEHHDISIAALHVHLDTERCLEMSIPKQQQHDPAFRGRITSQRVVSCGASEIIPT